MMVGRQSSMTNRTCTRRASLRHPMALVTAGAVLYLRHISSTWFGSGMGGSRRRSTSLSMPAAGASFCSVATALSYAVPPKPSRRTAQLQQPQQHGPQHSRSIHQNRNLGHFSSHPIIGFLTTRTTSSSTTTTTRRYSSNEKDNVTDNHTLSSYKHLPRVFVEPTSNNKNHKNKMSPKALVSLSSSQSHYLQTVMRLSNPKRWGDLINHVRIFNGHDGEWLAKLLVVNDLGTSSSSSTERRRPTKNINSNNSIISNNDDDAVLAQCLTCLVPQPPPLPYHVTLWMPSLKKKERRKWLLEKVTELGINAVGFIQTDYSEVVDANSSSGTNGGSGGGGVGYNKGKNKYKPSTVDEEDKNTIKDLAYMIEAAEQCERCTIPKLLTSSSSSSSTSSLDDKEGSLSTVIPNSLSEIVETIWKNGSGHVGGDQSTKGKKTVTCWLICRERNPSSHSIFQALENLVAVGVVGDEKEEEEVHYDIHILVGPEGGWSPAESQQMEAAIQQQQQQQQQQSSPTMILQGVSLGPLILRAETAAITAVGAVMLHYDYYNNQGNAGNK